MKLTRNHAIEMFARLGQMALGNLDDKTLEDIMSNFNALRKVHEDFDSLKKELFKRIYGDTEKMEEDERKKISEFFDMLVKIERAKREDVVAMDAACKAAYPELHELRAKEVKVLLSILNKEVDVDIVPVDENAFIKGVLKGRKDAHINDLHVAFAPLFIKAEDKGTVKVDFSELDELLK